MKLLVLCLATTTALTGGQPGQASRPAAGSICIAPVADDGDPRSHVSDAFAVRIDDREWVAVPAKRPRLIPDIALEGRRVVRIRDGKRQIESFRFEFSDFASRDLCLWYKPWYATWSLTEAAGHGSTCRCSRGGQSPAPLSTDDALLDALVFEPLLTVDSRAYGADLRTELDGYLLRARRNLRLGRAPETREAMMLQVARTRYTARLIGVGGDEAKGLAAAYVDALKPCYEWEGLHDCPEREAVFADQYQSAHAGGPFRSYLPLLSAHRWLCAAEAFDFEKKPDQASRSRQHYRDRLAIALRSASAMIRYAANHLSTRGACFARS